MERPISDALRTKLESAAAAPFYATTGMSLTHLEPGFVVAELRSGEDVTDAAGRLLPGMAAAAADSAFGAALYSLLPPSLVSQTVELRLDALPGVTARSDRLVARGTAVHVGESTGLARGEILDGDGSLRAIGTCRCIVRASEPGEHVALRAADAAPRSSLDPPSAEPRLGPEVTSAADLEGFARSRLARRLGLTVAEVGERAVVVRIPVSSDLTNIFGMVHGGAVSLFAEVAIAAALHALLPAGSGFAVLDFAINFLRPVPPDGVVEGEAEVVHSGRRFGVVRTQLRNPDGRIAAIGSSTIFVASGRDRISPDA